jgi:uncharacterized repeat protein (TIGR01451 family)
VNFDLGGANITQVSGTVSFTVDERIDVVVTLQSPSVPVISGDSDRSLLFTVTNTGNGSELFNLAIDSIIPADNFDPVPAVPAIYFDTDASGAFNAGDVAYTPGVNEPLLLADESINILLVNNIPAGLANGDIGQSELTATSETGSGAPGLTFANQGDGNTDAVIGATTGTAADAGEYLIADVQVSVIKSVVVSDPFGGTEPVPGATLTYSVTVQVSNSGTAINSVFADPIPVNTTYVPASIQLNGLGLSDAVDPDAGEFDSSGVSRVIVRLGDLIQTDPVQTVRFQVIID